MANLTETSTYEVGIYQLEELDPVQGGPTGISNLQAKQLANRTKWLYDNLLTTQASVAANRSRVPQCSRNAVLTGAVSATGVSDCLQALNQTAMRIVASPSTPVVFSVANGFDQFGEVSYTVRLTANLDFVDGLSGDRYAVLIFDPLTNTTTFEVAFSIFIQTSAPTAAPRRLWYNPVTAVTKFSYGATWEDAFVCIVGEWRSVGGSIDGSIDSSTVRTYPYRKAFYDESVPVGTIIPVTSTRAPFGGYLLCNGAAVSRSLYGLLFAEIGTRHGAGNGSTTFNLPNLQGEFLRGNDNGRGVDVGRVLGSSQTDEIKAHTHSITQNSNDNISPTGGTTNFRAGADTAASARTGSTGGVETRPRNVSTNFWIKF